LEGGRRLFLECEQMYAKVLGADHEETLMQIEIGVKRVVTVKHCL
jgi:hypothetical protein